MEHLRVIKNDAGWSLPASSRFLLSNSERSSFGVLMIGTDGGSNSD
jgi:hypothetical protein